MGFVKFIASLLLGPVGKMFSGFMEYKTMKEIVGAEVAKESIRANVELSQIKLHMHQLNMGWWATRWIVPLIAYPVIVWWICVFVDTIFQFPNWSVAAPPEPIYSWSGEIILSFFIVRGMELAANAFSVWSAAGAIGNVFSRAFGGLRK